MEEENSKTPKALRFYSGGRGFDTDGLLYFCGIGLLVENIILSLATENFNRGPTS